MATKRGNRWTAAEATRVLDRADRSGVSDYAFGKRHGIDPQRVRRWRKRLGRARRRVSANQSFVELRARAVERIEIELRNGRRVVVPATIDVRVAAQFADAIEGGGDC